MNRWIRKTFVVLITILTFGIVTPSQAFYTDVNVNKTQKRNAFEATSSKNQQTQQLQTEEAKLDKVDLVAQMIKEAEEQSYRKFGNRILPVIKDEFQEMILPNIEVAIKNITTQYPEEALSSLTISETPSGGDGEKIFNIIDNDTGKDIIRFHVRKDRPPQAGFWFNFHYHTHHDNFQTHHDLGSIYWDKKTPPKWMN
ncbi:YpjP family protein [Bacillus aquiflavi]|uniref:YpjP family protein n=1 Tax=Bacillus aquiflavi TaxID=2672567 RepID=UPI001CA9C81C|nr:YpjP family protein [Bacillus aquiflavi]UAC46972.1 YpjP family protein [Bacillus aquiflavi]